MYEGISKFNQEGIEVICNYVNGDLKDLSVRLEKLQELSEEYNNFTMLDTANEGSVKFILVIDSLKDDNDSKEEIIIEDKKSEH